MSTDTAATAFAAVYVAPQQIEYRTFPLPEIGDGDLLVEVILCGVDGSEVHMFNGEYEWMNERVPVILGDEIIGRVVAIGDGAARDRGLALGDRVVVESRWPCSGCRSCDLGQYYLCERRQRYDGYGTLSCDEPPHLWGGYSTHVYVPAKALVYAVPETLSHEAALVGCSALANGIRWTEVGGVTAGKHLAIVGPGPQGLACALAAIEQGARVTLLGTSDDDARLAKGAALGVESVITVSDDMEDVKRRVHEAVGEVDVVIDAAGVPAAKNLALELVRPMGSVVNVAVTSPSAQLIDWNKVRRKETLLINPVSHPHKVGAGMALAAALLEKDIDLSDWVSHRFPLSQAREALEAAGYRSDERPVKVVLDMRLPADGERNG